jgi:hypothetical protein
MRWRRIGHEKKDFVERPENVFSLFIIDSYRRTGRENSHLISVKDNGDLLPENGAKGKRKENPWSGIWESR